MKSLLKKTPALGAALIFGLVSTTALAQDNNRVANLENQLQDAVSIIKDLQKEVQQLKRKQNTMSRSTHTPAGNAGAGDVGTRLEDIENIVYDIDEKVGGNTLVNAFDAESINLGGFLHQTFTHVEGEDSSESSFNRTIFELLLSADITDNLSAFFATAFIREGSPDFTDGSDANRRNPKFNVENKTRQVIGWGNWEFSDAANVRFGRFITPHGIVNIDHFPAILIDPEQPQFLRPFGGDTIFPNFVNGVEFHGSQFVNGMDTVRYNAYVANHQADSERLLAGGRAEYGLTDYGVKVGANASAGSRDNLESSSYIMYGADLLYDKGPVLWKNEVFVTDEDLGDDRFAFYTQPAYRLSDKWIAFYRYDYLDNGGTGAEAGDTIENVVGINFLPTPRLRLRATATNREFEDGGGFDDADAQLYQLSATLSF